MRRLSSSSAFRATLATVILAGCAVDAEDMYAWVNRLADGAPVADARIEIVPYGITGATAAEMARTLLAAGAASVHLWVLARTPAPGSA